MKAILFVAELRGGFGHARRLLPLMSKAHELGYQPIRLARNPTEVAPIDRPSLDRGSRAPTAAGPPERLLASQPIACSFAHILGRAGFDDEAWLAHATSAWDATLNELRPAAVVCEFSPLLCLALWGSALPTLVVGHGFV